MEWWRDGTVSGTIRRRLTTRCVVRRKSTGDACNLGEKWDEMAFYGGDTDAMRQEAERFSSGAADLTSLLSSLGASVQAVEWVGADADMLRSRCSGVIRQGQEYGHRIAALSRQLNGHAAEQDRASITESGGSLGAIAEFLRRFGSPVESGISEGSRASGSIGAGLPTPSGLFGGSGPDLGGHQGLLANTASAMTPEHDGGKATGKDHGELDGEVAEGSKGWSRTDSVTAAGDGDSLTVSTTNSGDGSTTDTVTLTARQQKLEGGPLEGSFSKSAEVGITHDPESGTVSYTFEVADIAEAGGELEGSKGGLGVESSVTAAGSYTVTLPEGATLADALGVNPADPTTLPPGGSFAIEDSLTAVLTDSGSLKHGGIEFGAEASASVTVSTVTEISRGMDGTYEIATGEAEDLSGSGGVSIGIPDILSVKSGPSGGFETSTVEHAVFADTAEGRAQMQESYGSGTLPSDTSEAVLDRFTDEHEVSTNGTFVEGKLGNDDASLSARTESEAIAYESVQRTHSNGHQEGLERVHQEGATSYVEARTETGEETLYAMATDQDHPRRGNIPGEDPFTRDTFDDFYSPVADSSPTEAQDSRIVYTERELEQMRAHEDPSAPSGSELEYLWKRSSEDPTRATETMYRDYNGLGSGEPIPQGVDQSDPDVPGRSLVPGQPVGSAY